MQKTTSVQLPLVLCLIFILNILGLEVKLRVALHAQSRYVQHRWVAGSEITTRGLQKAFSTLTKRGGHTIERHNSPREGGLARARLHADLVSSSATRSTSSSPITDASLNPGEWESTYHKTRASPTTYTVDSVRVFAPFVYDGLEHEVFDLVITEGYTGSISKFIHSVRQTNPDILVLHYLLDTYPSLDAILRLDVDGYLTNSQNASFVKVSQSQNLLGQRHRTCRRFVCSLTICIAFLRRSRVWSPRHASNLL